MHYVAAICLAVEASTQKISSDAHNKRECEERKEDPRPLSIVHGDSLQSLGKRARPSLNGKLFVYSLYCISSL